MATVAERNARLDALATAAKAWHDKQIQELQHRVESSKKILRGRTGAERLARAGVTAASDLVIDQIDDFLVAK